MGITGVSSGPAAMDCCGICSEKQTQHDKIIALAGNPNVGKSTVFNSLTGLNQHTGNWPGKTIASAQGRYKHNNKNFILIDLPGTYSLMAQSAEEEIARDFICFGYPDATVIVTDATCLERNLNLVLQTIEITENIVVCVNLMDEANKKKIHIDLELLETTLGVPVVGTSARSRKGLAQLMQALDSLKHENRQTTAVQLQYGQIIEKAVSMVQPVVESILKGCLSSRWVALKLLDGDASLLKALKKHLGFDIMQDAHVSEKVELAASYLDQSDLSDDMFRDQIVSTIMNTCAQIGRKVVTFNKADYARHDRRLDKLLTSKLTGLPILILLLFAVFWLTITGANYPSQMLASGLFWVEDRLMEFMIWLAAPSWLRGMLVDGVFRTLAWVVAVMLPPMAIFFPLFTLLEDSGYLPRIAFNLDNFFRKACAHGKQALTMCMGFGCNAAGVIGCRIIDSPRERLIAIITNNFVPCNGRFPTLIAIITMFISGAVASAFQSAVSAIALTGVIILGVVMTLFISKLLSKTLLKGLPSSFSLELPPYRRPQIGRVIIRSILDRTLFVLGRAIIVAAPAGLIIWVMANVQVGDLSLLLHSASFLDPFARAIGMDGYILLAFILGFPANEIVVPIIIMSYMASGSLMDIASLADLRVLFVENGWTWLTAVCTMLFTLMHWPCGTTCFIIKKESQSVKWTLVSVAAPTITGIISCFTVASVVRLLHLV